MNIKLVVVGKTVKGFVFDGTEEYFNRLKHYVNFSVEVIADVKNAKNLTSSQLKDAECENILSFLEKNQLNNQHSSVIVLLDEHGKEYRSTEFADYLQKQMNCGIKNLVFVIGGAYGFSDTVKEKFKEKLSVSKMTFSHQMIRLLFTEQLYRAFTIIKGEPYHNE
ncbi:MAG: 23S rRNA (pseudouridine(1915)-N(3))-methyltransferase RlmH [Bacteroidales bacterium]|nr:23S rRNA (pseudouridine(1915)-N(3))-methyltransferase RlmH [Bacteroidales bacterium]